MRIAIVGTNGFDTLEYNFWETFIHLGHEAKIFDEKDILFFAGSYSRRLISFLSNTNYDFAKWVYGKLLKKILDYEPELVLVTYRKIIPEFVNGLKRHLKYPVIHVNVDHVGTLGRQYLISSPYDVYFSKEPYWALTMKNKLNMNAYYLPECFNPRVQTKPQETKQECERKSGVDIVVAATLYPYRVRFLEQVLKKINRDLNIKIFGGTVPWAKTDLWKYHQGKSVLGPKKAAAFYGAKIVINNTHFCEYEGVNCRFFEVLGSGGFMICDDKPSLPELAVPDKEVVTFDSLNDAADRIKFYLDNPEKRWEIAEAGYQRAIKDHTYEKRIETIFSVLNKL